MRTLRSCRNVLPLLLTAASCVALISQLAQARDPLRKAPVCVTLANPVTLLQRDFPGNNWQFVGGRQDAAISDTWQLQEVPESKELILVCKGEPHGYLRTRTSYANYVLELDWRFPKDPNGNSGVLLFTSAEDRVWPESVQVQLHQPELGSTFPVGGARSSRELRVKNQLAKPLNQWNHCEIRCRQGVATVIINGHLVGSVTGCTPAEGAIGLQSEGSEIHFRAISIREIPIAQSEEVPLNAQVDESTAARKQ